MIASRRASHVPSLSDFITTGKSLALRFPKSSGVATGAAVGAAIDDLLAEFPLVR